MTTNDELQEELASVREELALLRAAMSGLQAQSPAVEPRLLSRRNLLRVAPVAAVGGALAAMSAGPAAAATGDPVLLGKDNDAGSGKVTIMRGGTYVAHPTGPPPPVTSSDAPALSAIGGLATDWFAADGLTWMVDGNGAYLAVAPQADFPTGSVASFVAPMVNEVHWYASIDGVSSAVIGRTAYSAYVQSGSAESALLGGTGFLAHVDGGVGVDSYATETTDPEQQSVGGVGVSATATTGVGVRATVTEGHAITASSTSATTKNDAVVIDYAGTSRALFAESTSPTNVNGTITGVNAGNGIGVWGEQRGTGAGFGLVGVAGKAGRGAQLTGGAAQLRLVPGSTVTHPTTGKAGDFFVDSEDRLWFCQKAASGTTAATWKQLA